MHFFYFLCLQWLGITRVTSDEWRVTPLLSFFKVFSSERYRFTRASMIWYDIEWYGMI